MASRIPGSLSGIARSRIAVPLVSFLVLLYVIVPNVGGFSESSGIIRRAKLVPALAAVLVVIGTYAAAAGIYQSLSFKRLSYRRTLLVQAATAFANRALPSGLGGIALITAYLHSEGYGLGESAAIVAVNSSLGVLGHLLLLAAVIATGAGALTPKMVAVPQLAQMAIAAVILCSIAVTAMSRKVRRKARRLLQGFIRQVSAYRRAPFRLAAAFALSLGLTFGSVTALYLCALSVGSDVTLWQSFMAFTVGAAVGTVIPTPGGLGGVEAGLVAGFVAYGSGVPVALAAVLLFRFITFWLLLLPGFVAFLRVRQIYRRAA